MNFSQRDRERFPCRRGQLVRKIFCQRQNSPSRRDGPWPSVFLLIVTHRLLLGPGRRDNCCLRTGMRARPGSRRIVRETKKARSRTRKRATRPIPTPSNVSPTHSVVIRGHGRSRQRRFTSELTCTPVLGPNRHRGTTTPRAQPQSEEHHDTNDAQRPRSADRD